MDSNVVPSLRLIGYSKDDPKWITDLLIMELVMDQEKRIEEDDIRRRNTWKKPDCFHEKYLCTGKLKFLVGPDCDGYKEYHILDKDDPSQYVIENYIYGYDMYEEKG